MTGIMTGIIVPFLATITVEMVVASFFSLRSRRAMLVVVLANAATAPLGFIMGGWAVPVAVVAEALILALALDLRGRLALLVSLAMNAASFLVVVLLSRVLVAFIR